MTERVPALREMIDVSSIFDQIEYTSAPIPPEDIVEGAPTLEIGPVWTSADGSKMHGLSRMTAGTFWSHVEHHETSHIIRGRMIMTLADGTSVELTKGDVVHLQPGATWKLTVLETVEESWMVSSANGPASI